MSFAEPSWLWIGAGACAVVVACFAVEARRRRRALARFVAARHAAVLTASVSQPRRRARQLLTLAGVACAFGALARPQWGYHIERERRQGLELMFAVDTSQSMLAQDARPSRLQRAKLAVQDLLQALPQTAVGLVAFAGDAFLQTPLTLDRAAFLQSLSALDTSVIPVPGSTLQSGIRVADRGFGTSTQARKLLVLLTDGEELEGSALEAAREAASHGVRIYVLGIGSTQGATIPVPDARGGVQLLRGPDGQIVHSRLEESALRAIAAVSGGRYRALQAGAQDAEAVLGSDLASLGVGSVEAGGRKVHEERFQWPLAAAALLLSFAWLLSDRRRGAPFSRHAVALAALIAWMAPHTAAHAQGPDALSSYNRAADEYKGKKFDAAARDYHAALDTRDLSLQQRAYYDLGNAQYRQGQALEDHAQKAQQYRAAIASYDAALALKKDDADATFNRDFVRKRLQELERQDEQSRKQEDQQRGESQKHAGDKQQNADGKQSSSQQQHADGKQPADKGSSQQQADQAQARSAQLQPGAGSDDQARAPSGSMRKPTTQPGAPALAQGLTRADAEHLLDALQPELHALPSDPAERNTHARGDQPKKDW